MGDPIRRAAVCAGLILATAVAGCSSSGGNGSPQTSSSAGGGGAHSPAARQITKVFKIFFDTKTSLNKESKSPNAVDITAKVNSVHVVSKNLAKVKFTIYSGKTTLLPDSPGFAVREGGHWKVAAQTFCSLLQLEGTAPAACKDKSITSLHG
jgi:hypothetical protein